MCHICWSVSVLHDGEGGSGRVVDYVIQESSRYRLQRMKEVGFMEDHSDSLKLFAFEGSLCSTSFLATREYEYDSGRWST